MPLIHQDEEWLTLAEAAEFIGINVDEVAAAIRNGKLRHGRINRQYYVPRSDAANYIVRSKPADFVDGLWDSLRLLRRWRHLP